MMTAKMVRMLIRLGGHLKFCFTQPAMTCTVQSEKDSKEEILKAFRLFDDDETVRSSLLASSHSEAYNVFHPLPLLHRGRFRSTI